MSHGDVMIAKEAEDPVPDRVEPRVVATPVTESFVSKQWEGDYIQQNDPWAKATSQSPSCQSFVSDRQSTGRCHAEGDC